MLLLALLQEGAHALLLVLGGEAHGEQLVLHGDAVVNVHLHAPVDAGLGVLDGDGGVGHEGLGHGDGLVQQLLGGIDGVDQADLLGLGGADGVTGEDQLLGLGDAHAAGQTLGAGEAGGDAQANLGLAELGAALALGVGAGGQDDVAAHGQLTAAAQGEAVHSGDGGDLQLLNAAHQGAAPLAPLAAGGHVHGALLADVGAGHEGAALAGDDEGAQLGVLLHLADQLLQLGDHSGIQRVQRLGTVDGGNADAVLLLITNRLIHVGVPPQSFNLNIQIVGELDSNSLFIAKSVPSFQRHFSQFPPSLFVQTDRFSPVSAGLFRGPSGILATSS